MTLNRDRNRTLHQKSLSLDNFSTHGDAETKFMDLQGQMACQKKSCIAYGVVLCLVTAIIFLGAFLTYRALDDHKEQLSEKDGKLNS